MYKTQHHDSRKGRTTEKTGCTRICRDSPLRTVALNILSSCILAAASGCLGGNTMPLQTQSTTPASLSALSCAGTAMTGSGTDVCTVTLNAAAGGGGFAVSLSSNDAAVTVPASVTVPANATSAEFTATVSAVATARKVTLMGSADSVSQSFALQLNAAVPTVTVASSGSPSTYGDAVTFTTTISSGPTGTVTFYDGSVSIGAGTISGTTAVLSTSALKVGSHSITANWAGNGNYASATSGAITEVVNQGKPLITWATPAAILYGTALSATQLDASSTVPGSFVYSPAAGAVPALGSQTLSVTFTPTDTTDYTAATQMVTLAVNQGISTLSINATSVGFGSVALNTLATQTVTLTSTGTLPVTVSSATVTGTGFSLAGSTLSATLSPGQTATLGVQFDPAATGTATGQLTILSNSSTNATGVIPLTGSGTLGPTYVVDLTWDAPASSTDPIAGYNIYRALSGTSMYLLLNESADIQTTFVDSGAQNGQTYDYIVESVDTSGIQSVPTNPISVSIP